MSINTQALQRQAALLIMDGNSLKLISEALKVKRATIDRWRQAPYFLKELERLKNIRRQDLELRMIRMADDLTYFVESGLQRDAAPNCEMYEMIDMLKNVKNLGVLPQITPQNQLKSAQKIPKSVKTSTKPAASSTNPPPEPPCPPTSSPPACGGIKGSEGTANSNPSASPAHTTRLRGL